MSFLNMMAGAGKFSNVVSQEAKASAAMELTKSSRNILVSAPRPRFNRKMSSYQCRKSHCGDKMVVKIVSSPQWDFLYW